MPSSLFQFDTYQPQSIGQMVALMMAPAQARAAALREGAHAQAQAAQASGQAWSGAAGTIGAIAAGIPGQLEAQKDAAQARELRAEQLKAAHQGNEAGALQLEQTKRAQNYTQALADAVKSTPKVTESGAAMFDTAAIAQRLSDAGFGDHADVTAQHLEQVNNVFRQGAALRQQQIGVLADKVRATGFDPTLATYLVNAAADNGLLPRDLAQQYATKMLDGGPEAVKAIVNAVAGPEKTVTLKDGDTVKGAISGDLVMSGPPKSQVVGPGGTIVQGGKPTYTAPPDPTRAATLAETQRHNRAVEANQAQANATAAARATAQAGDTTDLTDAGLDAAALNYAKTGQLPPLGTGDKTTRKRIINRAAEMMPGLDIASAKADYTANQGALTSLVKQREAMGAFEATASKNLGVFIDAAKKISDSGSPLLNRPLRSFSDSVLGSPDMAAYQTARRTVIPEFAKILANPGLSGQLSDSARKEVEDVVSGNATLKQTLAAAQVLMQDVHNRSASYDDQIAGIRARLAKAQQPQSSGPVTVTAPNGKTYTFADQASADAFKRSAGIN